MELCDKRGATPKYNVLRTTLKKSWDFGKISQGGYTMDNKGNDIITTFIGGCITIVVLFGIFTLVLSAIL